MRTGGAYGTLFRNVNNPANGVKSDNLYHQLSGNTPFNGIAPGQLVWGIDRDDGYLIIVGRMWNVAIRFHMKDPYYVRCSAPSVLHHVIRKATLDTVEEIIAATTIISTMEEYHQQAKRLDDAYLNHFTQPRGKKE